MNDPEQPGWYKDPAGRYQHRFWDGRAWTQHVGNGQARLVDPGEPPTSTSLNDAEAQQSATRRLTDLDRAIAIRQRELEDLTRQLVATRSQLELEEVGLFEFEHPAEASAELGDALTRVSGFIKAHNKIGDAIQASATFTFGGSRTKGQTFVDQMSRIMLRAYNAEAENAVKTVKAGSLGAAVRRLESIRSMIEKNGSLIELRIDPRYHELRVKELELAAEHLAAVAAAREQERERRAELREQRRAEEELRRERERLEKERCHYQNSISRLRSVGSVAQAEELEAELERIDEEISRNAYRTANIRAGYVYVISNIGAFGYDVVKIGMTRRLDPMDRIRELGDASVPFNFDVHALFFSEDAVGVEALLHRTFAAKRLNKVNHRREFFHATPGEVLQALQEHKVSVLEFNPRAAADDFRASWPHGYPAQTDSTSEAIPPI